MVASAAVYALLASLAAPALGAVHERIAAVPNGWSLVHKAADDQAVTLSIALVRQNLDQLESKLMARAMPGQPQYGQWMDKQEIETHFPTADSQPVVDWLKSNGITQIYQDGSMLNFATTVGTVSKMLQTSFSWYRNGDSTKLRTTEYSIPDSLTNHVSLIAPTVFFGRTQVDVAPLPTIPQSSSAQTSAGAGADACSPLVTPDCLKELYNLGDYQPDANSGSRIAFGSFLNQSASYADLAQYEQHFNIPSQSFSVELINGGVNTQDPATIQDGEADLDAELIVAVSHPLPVTEYITGGSPYDSSGPCLALFPVC